MTKLETLKLNLGSGKEPLDETDRQLLFDVLEEQDARLMRIEKSLGIEPPSAQEEREAKQDAWFAASEPWREELRKARKG